MTRRATMPDRKPTWHQDTPRMQLCSCVMSAQGDLLNLLAGDSPDPKKAMERALGFLNEAQEILRHHLPEGEWPKEPG